MSTTSLRDALRTLAGMLQKIENLTLALGAAPELPALEETLSERALLVRRMEAHCEQLTKHSPNWRNVAKTDAELAPLASEISTSLSIVSRLDRGITNFVRENMNRLTGEMKNLSCRSRAVRSYESHRFA